jgi:hypothetical protein
VRKSPQRKKQEETYIKESIFSREEGEEQPLFSNIHGGFELNKFNSIYHLLTNLIACLSINEVEVLKAIKNYIQFVSKESIDNVADLKFIFNKRELLKQSFAIEREAVLTICFAIVIDCY